MSDERKCIKLFHLGGIAVIRLDRPAGIYGLTEGIEAKLSDVFSSIEYDTYVKVSVLIGTGFSFTTHATETRDRRLITEGVDSGLHTLKQARRTKPVIAALSGYVVGAGLDIATWCDLRVAADSTIFASMNQDDDVNRITHRLAYLTSIIGQAAALDLMLTGRHIHAAEAKEIG